MTQLDLFSGIGGFALACRWAGVQTIGFAEIDAYACKVLAKNFPGVPNYGDIRTIPAGLSAWLVTGGFPCQPFSVAGKRGGATDDRWLWPAMAAVVESVRPAWVLAENVPGIIGMELDTVLLDLENLHYTAWATVVPACAVDAQHRRDRVWIVARTDSGRQRQSGIRQEQPWRTEVISASQAMAHADSARKPSGRDNRRMGREIEPISNGRNDDACRWQPEPELGRVAHGVPARVDRLRGLGNAIVPQVAYQLIRMMIDAEGVRP